jgi:hypothetical protein
LHNLQVYLRGASDCPAQGVHSDPAAAGVDAADAGLPADGDAGPDADVAISADMVLMMGPEMCPNQVASLLDPKLLRTCLLMLGPEIWPNQDPVA